MNIPSARKIMKIPYRFPQALSLLLGLLLFTETGFARILSFKTQQILDADFPEVLRIRSGMHGEPLVNMLSHPGRPPMILGNFTSLFAGDSLNISGDRQGRLSIYTATDYAPELDFVSTRGLVLKIAGLMTNYAITGSGYQGNIGLTSLTPNPKGLGSAKNAIFFQIDRVHSEFKLMMRQGNRETVLASWSAGSIEKQRTSINPIGIKALVLTLTAETWAIDVTFVNKSSQIVLNQFKESGNFPLRWTKESWGRDTFLGIDSLSLYPGKEGDITFNELQVGEIKFDQIH